ncbi:MAG: hypothetical protein U5K56_20935 [Halioglobus sp.]|nr:hypothetical protein [Halioglobus sp.]
MPAFASCKSLAVTAPLPPVGGFLITLPMAPAVRDTRRCRRLAPARRAVALRSVVRSIGMVGPVIIGALSSIIGLQAALIVVHTHVCRRRPDRAAGTAPLPAGAGLRGWR